MQLPLNLIFNGTFFQDVNVLLWYTYTFKIIEWFKNYKSLLFSMLSGNFN